ncbi:hypothetical protein INT43_008884 [Umbelopsis isabellina]|uniref:NodB homology domain-containing protein n=1 Tax=Mortierella isabellina TaxID=91625 RepID=A0A8H7PWD2_MORIS|nr:hypothetical protein INT43_008884 [Umbelopsis isabellina]
MLLNSRTLAILATAFMATSFVAAQNGMDAQATNSALESDLDEYIYFPMSDDPANPASSLTAAEKHAELVNDNNVKIASNKHAELAGAEPVATLHAQELTPSESLALKSSQIAASVSAKASTLATAAALTPEQQNQLDREQGLLPVLNQNPTKISAQSLPNGALPAVPMVTGCRTQGQIAVTYSEGPSDATARIVKQLNAANAKGTFFVNATWLYSQQYASVLQNTYNNGHFIGMTYRVKNDDSSTLTDDEIRNDIINDAATIHGLINVAPKYVRLHYSDPEDTRTENIIKDLGMVIVGYNLDSQDYDKNSKTDELYKAAFKRQKDTYDAKGSFISIQYDIPDTTSLAAVSNVINAINDEGYTMVRMDGCLNDAKPYKKDAASLEYVGDKFSFNTTGYKEGQTPLARGATADDGTTTVQESAVSNTVSSGTSALTMSLGSFAVTVAAVLVGLV